MIITGAMTGSILVLGMGFTHALTAMIIGNLIMLAYVGALGLLGTRGGVNFALLASVVFGRKGYVLASGLLFLFILARAHAASRTEPGSYRFSRPIHPVRSVPIALNSHGIWLALMIALTVTNYGYPIAALVAHQDTSVPAIYEGAQ